MATVELVDYAACEQALKETTLRQALYDEAEIVLDRVLVTLHGETHRQRRLAVMKVFRRDFFKHYEQDVIPGIVDDVLGAFPQGASADIADLGYRCLVDLAMRFAGLDRRDDNTLSRVEETRKLVELLRLFGVSATLGQSIDRDRDAARREIRAAVELFDQSWFGPSLSRREALIASVLSGERGERAEDTLPMDVLTVLMRNRDTLELDRAALLRETAFFFLAGAHTSVHSLGHIVHHLLEWCEAHAGARAQLEADPSLLQRFVQESLRLHPSSPVAMRIALEQTAFADGQDAAPGDRVIINLRAANRSCERFGADAAEFNPFRVLPAGVDGTGLTFGRGMHACLGRNLAAGAPTAGTESGLQRGMLTVLAHRLLCRGVAADANRQARLDKTITRETWATYPVVFSR